jgi:glutamine cyclotransferase
MKARPEQEMKERFRTSRNDKERIKKIFAVIPASAVPAGRQEARRESFFAGQLLSRFEPFIDNIVLSLVLIAVCGVIFGVGARPSIAGEVPVYGYKIINTYPHDQNAFTQGLIFEDGLLYEGTGLYGRSELRKVEMKTGRVLKSHRLPRRYFGEGITTWKDKVVQLTWRGKRGFVYDKESFGLVGEFPYSAEGWGLTHDDKRLIMSDGSAYLYFLDPQTFKEIGRIRVNDNGVPVAGLNELEYVKGKIYANVWPTERIVIISPETGRVEAWIDLSELARMSGTSSREDVLNGIAYDVEQDRLFVTGKRWPKLFEIRVVPAR